MKMSWMLGLVALSVLVPIADAHAARVRVVERGPHGRTRVVVRAGFPIRRSPPLVVVRRHPVVVTERIVYGPPVVWRPVVVIAPPRERLTWEDGETLLKSEGWTEVTLEVNGRGDRLFLELLGRTQLDWAEVVFGNGHAEVVDFSNRTHEPGLYSLLDFRDGREVRFVRLLAHAKSPEARVVVRLQK